MVDFPDLKGKTLFLILINLVGLAVVSVAVLGTTFGYVQPSLPLFASTGFVWVVALLITAWDYFRN